MDALTTGIKNSASHWLSVKAKFEKFDVRLGRATAQAYVNDPRMIAFIAARYKFAAKVMEGADRVLEVGCGDAFGAPIVTQTVDYLTCTDIDFPIADLYDLGFVFARWNPCDEPYRYKQRGIYLIDVIEHIFPHEEVGFMRNIAASLDDDGIILIGTPNVTASAYASEHSRNGHVNLKSHSQLRELGKAHFKNVFMFGMNDEVVHTGFGPMAHYLWMLGVGPIRQ